MTYSNVFTDEKLCTRCKYINKINLFSDILKKTDMLYNNPSYVHSVNI